MLRAQIVAPRMKVVLMMLTMKRWSPTCKNKLTLFSNESSPKSFNLVDLHELRLRERKLLRDFPVTRRRQSLEDALDVRVLGKDGGLQLFVTFLLLQMKWRSSTKEEKIRSTDGIPFSDRWAARASCDERGPGFEPSDIQCIFQARKIKQVGLLSRLHAYMQSEI